MFSRVSASRLIGALVQAAATPAILHASLLIAATTSLVTLIAVAVIDVARTRRHPRPPLPPG